MRMNIYIRSSKNVVDTRKHGTPQEGRAFNSMDPIDAPIHGAQYLSRTKNSTSASAVRTGTVRYFPAVSINSIPGLFCPCSS